MFLLLFVHCVVISFFFGWLFCQVSCSFYLSFLKLATKGLDYLTLRFGKM